MELATGAMGSLLPKLVELLSEEYNLLKSVRREVISLREEMVGLEAALLKIAEVPLDQLDPQVRIWASSVRELSYAMEDSIDRFAVSDSDPNSVKGLVKKIQRRLNTISVRHQIADDIRDIKSQIREVADRHARYKIDNVVADPVATTTVDDPDLLARSDDHRELVGVQWQVEELISMLLSDEGSNKKQQLKIVSIVGFGGLGKTTLAKAVYERMRTQFDCTAFVSVGLNPKATKVFKDILFQIDEERYSGASAAAWDEKQCIDIIRELLENKRYFIILNDIWDTQAWEIIRCAFTENCLGSMVITTTRILDLAMRAGHVYRIKPLSDEDSRELFNARLFAGKAKRTDYETTELVHKILKRCGGIPLAIITMANLLANKPKEDWCKVYDSLGFGAADEYVVNTRKILSFSYYYLPIHVRACLLHLSIFPEDYMVRKDTLIWKWVAEGFIREESGVGLFEIGERYFNKLLNMSMIQPVEIQHSGVIIGCRVHNMVLDMICLFANEENFVTVLNDNEHRTSSEVKVRRLALHGKFVGEQLSNKAFLEAVRSFNVISIDTSMMPSLLSFKVLRVLAIEDCGFEMEGLEHIGVLLHLRYLGLWKTPVGKLPEEVGNLKFLEVLDLRQTGLRELPKSVSLLSRLKCLRADGGSTRVPDWIDSLTSLEELTLNDVSSCPSFVKQVSKLKELRELKIWIRVLDERSKKALVKSLGSLQKIHVLHLDGGLWIEDAEWEGYVPPRQLRRLNLRSKSSRLPRWINDFLLPKLSHLSVDVRVVEAKDLAILGSLPELISLELFMSTGVSLDVKSCGVLDVKSCGVLFPKLRHCYSSGMLRFLQGAAPRLEYVHFNVMLSGLTGASFQCGSLGNLPSLKEVRVEIFYSDIHVATEVEDRLRHAVNVHINHPVLNVSRNESYLDEVHTNSDAEKEDTGELEEEAEWDEWYPESPTAKAT
ncbi:unnamed protein product [Alopecurus aequalis]